MLDAYVIDEIKRREQNRDRDVRPTAEIPSPSPSPPTPADTPPENGDRDRGVVIIDYTS